jgi:hypothetical protein
MFKSVGWGWFFMPLWQETIREMHVFLVEILQILRFCSFNEF